MVKSGPAKKLTIYVDEADKFHGKPVYEVLLDIFFKRKISGGAGLLFKGKGFYITDYRSENYKKKAAEEKPKSEASKEKKDTSKPKPESLAKSSCRFCS